MKSAIIDLGSNTIRLSVYHILEGGGFELLFSKKEMAGLVGYIRHGVLSQEGIEKACNTLKTFISLLRQLQVEDVHVFATASLRNITNTDEAVHLIYQRTGILVDVISGKLEAAFGYYGAFYSDKPNDAALFDIGGGSTEILEVKHKNIYSSQSLSMGSLNLFSQFVSKLWPKDKEISDIQKYIQEMLAKVSLPEGKFSRIYGIGGTARAAMRIINDYYGRNRDCNIFTRKDLEEVTSILLEKNKLTKKLIINNCPDRIHTIIPGILIMNALSENLCGNDIFISKYGVREGYLCHKILKNTI